MALGVLICRQSLLSVSSLSCSRPSVIDWVELGQRVIGELRDALVEEEQRGDESSESCWSRTQTGTRNGRQFDSID